MQNIVWQLQEFIWNIIDCWNIIAAFDCNSRDCISFKLEAYGFLEEAIDFIHSYWSNRKRQVKVNGTYRTWKNIFYGVPRDPYSVLCHSIYNYVSCSKF